MTRSAPFWLVPRGSRTLTICRTELPTLARRCCRPSPATATSWTRRRNGWLWRAPLSVIGHRRYPTCVRRASPMRMTGWLPRCRSIRRQRRDTRRSSAASAALCHELVLGLRPRSLGKRSVLPRRLDPSSEMGGLPCTLVPHRLGVRSSVQIRPVREEESGRRRSCPLAEKRWSRTARGVQVRGWRRRRSWRVLRCQRRLNGALSLLGGLLRLVAG